VVTCYIAGDNVEWPLMKVIIAFTFCCDNLRKSKFMALENSGNFFSYVVATLDQFSHWTVGLINESALLSLMYLHCNELWHFFEHENKAECNSEHKQWT